MRRSHVVAWVMLFVVLNAAMVWFLRDRMMRPPEPLGASAEPSASSTNPAESAEPVVRGQVFLAGSPGGAVLRLTQGNCDADDLQVSGWIAPPDAGPITVELPAVAEVAAVGRIEGSWWIIGTDSACEIKAWRSQTLLGGPWSETGIPEGAWYLDPQDPTQVNTPRGRLALPEFCSANWVQTVDVKAYLVCEDGRAQVTEQGVRQFADLPLSAAVVAIAATADGRLAQLMTTPGCRALLRVIERETVADQHCFEPGKAPLGLAWVGEDLVAQIGFDLMDNAGGTWAIRS